MKDRPWYRYWASGEDDTRRGAAGDATFHVKRTGVRENGAAEEAVRGVPNVFHVEQEAGPAPAGTPGPDPSAWPSFHVEQREPQGALEAPVEIPLDDDAEIDTAFERARVLTVVNQKGGVGKTTTAVSLAAALADLGARILLLDLDPQGNASSGVGLRVQEGQPTIYDVLVGDMDLVDAIEPTSVRNLFVVPATIHLAGAEIELVSAFSREQKLRRAIEGIRGDFDLVLIDCPPSLGLLTVNAVSAADGIVVPIQCEYYALEGLGALQRNAELIRANLNPDLQVTGYVMTMMDGRTRLSQQVVDEVVSHFGDLVFSTRIPRSVRLAEAPSYGQPITVFDPSSRGARAYRSLAREVLRRLQNDEPAEVNA